MESDKGRQRRPEGNARAGKRSATLWQISGTYSLKVTFHFSYTYQAFFCENSLQLSSFFYRIIKLHYPLKEECTLPLRWLRRISISTWFIAIIFSAPPLFGWSEYILNKENHHCSNTWQFNPNNFSYLLFCVVFGFAVPYTTAITINIIFLRKIKKMSTTIPVNRTISIFIIASTTAFTVAWLPLVVCGFVEMAIGRELAGSVTSKMLMLTKSTLVVETTLFLLLNKNFHKAARMTRRHVMRSTGRFNIKNTCIK